MKLAEGRYPDRLTLIEIMNAVFETNPTASVSFLCRSFYLAGDRGYKPQIGVTRRTKATASTGRANNGKDQRTKQKKENSIIFEQSILIHKRFFGSSESVHVFC